MFFFGFDGKIKVNNLKMFNNLNFIALKKRLALNKMQKRQLLLMYRLNKTQETT